MVNEFRDGDLDVLVCTSAGERGLNLQTADTLIHYDLAWTPKSLLQRTGRVERIGATAEEIEIIYPVMVDTVEERVVGLVVARAGTALQVLDAPRGVDVTKTELGRALGSLPTAISGTGLNKKDQAMLEFTKELLLAA
jgi:superfamily II DNA/RNA helicase